MTQRSMYRHKNLLMWCLSFIYLYWLCGDNIFVSFIPLIYYKINIFFQTEIVIHIIVKTSSIFLPPRTFPPTYYLGSYLFNGKYHQKIMQHFLIFKYTYKFIQRAHRLVFRCELQKQAKTTTEVFVLIRPWLQYKCILCSVPLSKWLLLESYPPVFITLKPPLHVCNYYFLPHEFCITKQAIVRRHTFLSSTQPTYQPPLPTLKSSR